MSVAKFKSNTSSINSRFEERGHLCYTCRLLCLRLCLLGKGKLLWPCSCIDPVMSPLIYSGIQCFDRRRGSNNVMNNNVHGNTIVEYLYKIWEVQYYREFDLTLKLQPVWSSGEHWVTWKRLSAFVLGSLTGSSCQRMSVSVLLNMKDAVVPHPHRGGMTLFVTVVMDSASLWGACASAVSERLSLCFTLARSHTDAHKRTAGTDNKGVLIQLLGNKIRLQRNSYG